MGGFEFDCHISSDPRKFQIVALKIATFSFKQKRESTFSRLFATIREGGGAY